ncbi:SusD/RagB family nutrient-binding outer membrane lipoprotein [Chitinophaga nivalis]|uniref:SusD/RagB family nutrient-binding outer membrane lipoprotein n=1 Tax=Chitinophaga nivalis TaxID=2991709 RepID=A0ABT3IES1_9BACT|nr:SusD/RagB family nutrient-binding outer membrane lipoprotein [Chitinophaga nivalis]MCW3467855.1 SusD/RagB family nutrient-binding outer membrane lipoprotein [Chitinophaga nivalis]MCW3482453.1 SusD/RagB family nutrient-binding outer membrane lipoprotein [Chitinophaga nivalis]
MKQLSYILILFTCWAGIQLTSCTKFSDSINRNPNQPDTFSNPKLLTFAIQRLDTTTATPYGLLYAQQLSEKIYTDASRYINISFEFSSVYADALMNLNLILKTPRFNEEEGAANNQLAVARILRAYFFWYITDRWGDVPYKEALQGRAKIDPAYDRQQDIYADLFKELPAAAAQLRPDRPAKGDILYYGDTEKWKRLAGTIHALMALRLSKVDPAWGKREFEAALKTGIFTSNADNVIFRHLSETAYQNYWYYVYTVQGRRWYCISKPLVDYMKPLGDPRLPVFAAKNGSDDYVGMPYGLEGKDAQNIAADAVSFQGTEIRKQNSINYLVTYAQVLLAKAEAIKLGWIPGGDAAARQAYEEAIAASLNQWTGTTTGLDAYIARPEVAYNPAAALKQIGYQRWVHLYMNGYEAWAEWRRTGYPVLTPAPDNGNIPIPRRQGYPLSEHNINTANVNAAISAQPGLQGKDDLTGRVWWDVQR